MRRHRTWNRGGVARPRSASSETTMVLDANFLCHQAGRTLGELASSDGAPSGVLFGFLSRLMFLADRFQPRRTVLCWDSGWSLRREKFPWYKQRPTKDLSEEEQRLRTLIYSGMAVLRETELTALGFRNSFQQDGLEADDLIAVAVSDPLQDFVIVSADEDLFQLLHPNVRIYNPAKQEIWTAARLLAERGVKPSQWAQVKAIGGCTSDTVPGVPGVRETTAVKYLTGALPVHHKAYQAIICAQGQEVVERNTGLVKLPFPTTAPLLFCKDGVTLEAFDDVCRRWELQSLTRYRDKWMKLFSKGNV